MSLPQTRGIVVFSINLEGGNWASGHTPNLDDLRRDRDAIARLHRTAPAADSLASVTERVEGALAGPVDWDALTAAFDDALRGLVH